jgi:hypothetical protein
MKLTSESSGYRNREVTRRSVALEYRPNRSFVESLALRLSVPWELTKRIGRAFGDTWNHVAFRSFWGEGVFSSITHFVIGNFEDVRVRDALTLIRDFSPLRATPDIGDEVVYGSFSTNAATMLTALFLRHSGRLLQIVTNGKPQHKWEGTLICYGSSEWNLKTFDIERSAAPLCEFVFDQAGRRAFEMGELQYTIDDCDGTTYDKAILLRLTNQENPEHCYIVCAGLSEWGSLAAVHYLTNNWKVLHKRFDEFYRRRDFCVLLQVPYGQFEKATEIASAVRLGNSA